MASLVFAACSDLESITEEQLIPASIGEVQLGLRTAYLDSDQRLQDGRLGAYTRRKLEDLCNDVPRPAGLDDVRSTLQLAVQYARLQQNFPGWAERLYALDLTAGGDAGARSTLGLRLAGTTAMTTLALGRSAQPFVCEDPGGALAQYPDGARALATLTRLFKDKTETDLCKMLPVAGGIDAWQQGMERLGRLSSSRVGALRVLRSDDFLGWIAAGDLREPDGTIKHLRRLAGTLPAVLTLIDDYNAQNDDGDGSTVYRGGPCSPRPQEQTLTYYALNDTDIESLEFFVSLTPKLDAFAVANGGFDSPQALWRELRPALAEDLDDCVLAEIEELVTGPETLPLTFLLKPAATDKLMGRPELETAVPVLTELAPARTPTRAELVNRIRAGLVGVQEGMVGEDVAAAADTLAAASEPVPPPTDTGLIEIDEEEEGAPDPTPKITVTEATDDAVESAIDNAELSDTIKATPIADATVPELMRAQVRAALEQTAARQVQRAVDDQIALIEPAVSSEWTLTPALRDEILALPYVRAAVADATAMDLPTRLQTLSGVAYPSFRLFEEALANIPVIDGQVPFSQFITERIIQKAQKNITDPEVIRAFGPFEVPECKCVPERLEDDLQVYGFYPFWFAPTPVRAGTEPDPEAPPPARISIDFSLTGQVAFYGLEFSDEGTSRVTLRNRDQWRAAKRDFVNSAHRFRARADLAFDLRNWMQWDDVTIEDVIDDIATEMAPFERVQSYELRHLRAALPTLFDPVQPDGVTLIFHGYQGNNLGEAEMKTLVRIVENLYDALPNRDRLHINVAFDFPLVGESLDQPLFDELYELLIPSPLVVPESGADTADTDGPQALDRQTTKIIDKILLFLERPTTDAKKGLRFRMEQGLFQGERRASVLRSIVPVLPPGGHEFVKTSVKDNAVYTPAPDFFSQFEDDIVYFKDNFSGVGFWPVPDPAGSETAAIAGIIADQFNRPRLPPLLASFDETVGQVCDFSCPNRAYIALAAIALFAILLLLTWRSFYNGIVHKIAFRFLTIGFVWIGNLVLVGTLLVLSFCDPRSVWPGALMWILIVLLGIILIYNFVQRIKNGPMP
ncbi:hypothetical protein [uncultured Roseobacter sp.]|uniref:hypothetical protein n=1 Tax=uncultured Roseobacter sp. TaxID=114847 RepID=UPI00262640AC|nr:hypothetical protein [uncultured Roseobacter sp.]